MADDASQLDSMQDEASKNNKEIAEDKLLEQKKKLGEYTFSS